jgi:hypothetical protein
MEEYLKTLSHRDNFYFIPGGFRNFFNGKYLFLPKEGKEVWLDKKEIKIINPEEDGIWIKKETIIAKFKEMF